jgi:hypothetical protein
MSASRIVTKSRISADPSRSPSQSSPYREFEFRTGPAMRRLATVLWHSHAPAGRREVARRFCGHRCVSLREAEGRVLRTALLLGCSAASREPERCDRGAKDEPSSRDRKRNDSCRGEHRTPTSRCRESSGVSLLKRAQFLVAGRALREMVVRGIADRQFAAGESSQQLRGRAERQPAHRLFCAVALGSRESRQSKSTTCVVVDECFGLLLDAPSGEDHRSDFFDHQCLRQWRDSNPLAS